jgi:hypothetical protein
MLAAGNGRQDAVRTRPYFRIFNPDAQTKKFDPDLQYIKKWVPEYADFSKYPKPIVDHAFARDRCLKVFKAALAKVILVGDSNHRKIKYNIVLPAIPVVPAPAITIP